MYLAGFSLNNLTLMALVIATGFVVDDAIVVIENISRYLEQGERPLQAALKGAGQIGFTIISLTISLVAVLIPLLFMGDVAGRLFREFAVTLAVTILISAVISLTLTPMLCAVMLRARAPRREKGEGRFFSRLLLWYEHRLDWVFGPSAPDPGQWPWARWRSRSCCTSWCPRALPGAGHGRDSGHCRGPADTSFTAMAERQHQLADLILQDRPWKAWFFSWAWTASTRAWAPRA